MDDNLYQFLNTNDFSRYLSSLITNFHSHLNQYNDNTTPDSTISNKTSDHTLLTEIDTLSSLFNVVQSRLSGSAVELVCQQQSVQVWTDLLKLIRLHENWSISPNCLKLLHSCLRFMNSDQQNSCLQFLMNSIFYLINNDYEHDYNQWNSNRLSEFVHKVLLNTKLDYIPLNIDWLKIENLLLQRQPQNELDSKLVIRFWLFYSKINNEYEKKLISILLRTFESLTNSESILFIELLLGLLCSSSSSHFLTYYSHLHSFWLLIQRSLANNDNDKLRKYALYLLKYALATNEKERIDLRNDQQHKLIVIDNNNTKLKQFWNEFIVIYECVENATVHLIKTVLSKFDILLKITINEDLSFKWLFILLQRLFINPSQLLSRWIVYWYLNIRVDDRLLCDEQIEEVIFLSTLFLIGVQTHFYLQSAVLLKLLQQLLIIKWSHNSFVYVIRSLRMYSLLNSSLTILTDEHIKLLYLILTKLSTYAPILRLSIYSYILDIVLNLVDWTNISFFCLLNLFSLYDRQLFLLNDKYESVILFHCSKLFSVDYLKMKIDEYLTITENSLNEESSIFSFETNRPRHRQIVLLIDLLRFNKKEEIIKQNFDHLFENIRTVCQRPYMSKERVNKSIELIMGLDNELFQSELDKNWLTTNIKSIVNDGLNYIKMELIKQPLDVQYYSNNGLVFITYAKRNDLIRFLDDIIFQIQTLYEHNGVWYPYIILFAYCIEWTMKYRYQEFVDLPLRYKSKSIIDNILVIIQNHIPATTSKTNNLLSIMLKAKYLLILNDIGLNSSIEISSIFIDDLHKASLKELNVLFRALAKLLQTDRPVDEKCNLLSNSLSVMNELDHRNALFWPSLSALCLSLIEIINNPSYELLLTEWFDNVLERSDRISGIINIVLEALVKIWLKQKHVQTCYFPFIINCVVFGDTFLKEKRYDILVNA
ncbi:unnamed protein product [Didymodactylos carnosus]|uniref:Uncharacterized protein n=1 Tax=Didymodactylos carnosus TaxID=1234261 RepID=A0A8S2EHW6_9BILA|nr:unnamed protein product [Didymodactylos carnosus]CAF4036407.1 unnamed protein product [Didymodactylos carnosus]